jgi:hypothetical protein
MPPAKPGYFRFVSHHCLFWVKLVTSISLDVLLFFVGLGFELKSSHLQGRLSTICHTSSAFWLGYFGDGGLLNYLPKLASNDSPPNLSLPLNWSVPSFLDPAQGLVHALQMSCVLSPRVSILFYLSFWWYQGLNLGPHAC